MTKLNAKYRRFPIFILLSICMFIPVSSFARMPIYPPLCIGLECPLLTRQVVYAGQTWTQLPFQLIGTVGTINAATDTYVVKCPINTSKLQASVSDELPKNTAAMLSIQLTRVDIVNSALKTIPSSIAEDRRMVARLGGGYTYYDSDGDGIFSGAIYHNKSNLIIKDQNKYFGINIYKAGLGQEVYTINLNCLSLDGLPILNSLPTITIGDINQ